MIITKSHHLVWHNVKIVVIQHSHRINNVLIVVQKEVTSLRVTNMLKIIQYVLRIVNQDYMKYKQLKQLCNMFVLIHVKVDIIQHL